MKIIAFFGTARTFDYFVRQHLTEMDPPRDAVQRMPGSWCKIGDVLLILHVTSLQSLRGRRGRVEVVVEPTFDPKTDSQRRDYAACLQYIKIMNDHSHDG
jgi:hypothetical protein